MHIRTHPKTKVIVHTIRELMRMQTQGKYLTPDEKKRVKDEAIERRIKPKKRLPKRR